MNKMKNQGYYGICETNEKTFNMIKKDFLIKPFDNPKIKYLCANEKETQHLKEIGIIINDEICCDWYKIMLN